MIVDVLKNKLQEYAPADALEQESIELWSKDLFNYHLERLAEKLPGNT